MQAQLLPQQQLPTCQTCSLEPLPQSSQYIVFIIAEFMLALISLKLSIIVLLISYCVSKTVWICPLCKREVQVHGEKASSTQSYIIIRLNDFMMLVSKGKFRICAILIALGLSYWFYTEPRYQYKPRVNIEKTWRSIVTNCGYDMFIQNSYRFNYLYNLYEETSEWELEGIYIDKQQTRGIGLIGKVNFGYLKIKMNPTQFKDQNTQDINVMFRNRDIELEKGDVIKMKGQWAGHHEHILVFLCTSIQKTGKKITNFSTEIEVLTHGSLRSHISQ